MQVHADFVADLEFALVLFQHGAILAKEKAALLEPTAAVAGSGGSE